MLIKKLTVLSQTIRKIRLFASFAIIFLASAIGISLIAQVAKFRLWPLASCRSRQLVVRYLLAIRYCNGAGGLHLTKNVGFKTISTRSY